jgi:hypothetical protein
MSEKNSFEEALAEMYAQLGNEEAARLRQELNAGFSQVSKAARKLIIKVLPFPLDALWAATRLITKAR